MKKFFLAIFIFAATASSAATQSETAKEPPGRFGLGAVLGAPTAITGKYWFTRKHAADFGIAWGSDYTVLLYGDYLFHYRGVFGHSTEFLARTDGYIGIGGGVFNWAETTCAGNRPPGFACHDGNIGLYARVPFGAEWFPPDPRLGVFAEISPGLALIPGLGVTIDLGIGVRYYF